MSWDLRLLTNPIHISPDSSSILLKVTSREKFRLRAFWKTSADKKYQIIIIRPWINPSVQQRKLFNWKNLFTIFILVDPGNLLSCRYHFLKLWFFFLYFTLKITFISSISWISKKHDPAALGLGVNSGPEVHCPFDENLTVNSVF